MEDKICVVCNEGKPFTSFNKCSARKSGLRSECRDCQKAYRKEYYEANREEALEYNKINADKIKTRQKKRYHADKEYREKSLKANRERRRLEDAKVLQRKNEKFRRDTNPNYKLGGALRNRIRGELNKLKKLNIDVNKCAKSIDLLGCSLSDYKTYIESLWEEGMNWENHGFGDTCWHIDHIKPCSFFDLTDPLQQRECFHFSNTQPLWQRDNLAKGDKLNHFK